MVSEHLGWPLGEFGWFGLWGIWALGEFGLYWWFYGYWRWFGGCRASGCGGCGGVGGGRVGLTEVGWRHRSGVVEVVVDRVGWSKVMVKDFSFPISKWRG